MLILNHFIDGSWYADASEQPLAIENPATGEVYGSLSSACAKTVDLAYGAASAAFPAWSTMPAADRGNWLRKLASGIEARFEEFVLAESRDSGKPHSVSGTVDIPRAMANLRFFADAATQFASESHTTAAGEINFTMRHPLGPVACISPWNLPLYLFTWKIAPALAVGNTVVAKPSEITPVTAHLLADVAREIGFPKGVLNIVHGEGMPTGEAIVNHPSVKAVSFTGGTSTGKRIASTLAPRLVKYSLELGGKNPVLIFDDCDLEQAVSTTARSSFSNSGQICLCGSRVYVQRGIYETFKMKLIDKANKLKIGAPDSGANIGPLVSKLHFEKVKSYLSLAIEEGATLHEVGNWVEVSDANEVSGYYMKPTIIEGLRQNSRCVQEEIFGPVISLIPFDTEEEALQLANDTVYGLSAVVWSSNMSRCLRLSTHLQAGIVWVNTWMKRDLRTPFGGVGMSGFGREGGQEALRFFTETKNVCLEAGK